MREKETLGIQEIEQAKLERAKIGFQPEIVEPIEIEELPELYRHSLYFEKLKNQNTEGGRVVLFSDIDQTFSLSGEEEIMAELARLLEKTNIPLVYITGREIERVENDENLPKADLIATAVGTEIWVRNQAGELQPDNSYREMLTRDWNRNQVYQMGLDFVEKIPALEFQEKDKPDQPLFQEFKVSFNFEGSQDEADRLSEQLNQVLNSQSAAAVVSKNFRQENKYFVDFLPMIDGKIGKLLAIGYLKKMIQIQPIFAGDSGNDLDILLSGETKGILVSNAQADARREVEKETKPLFGQIRVLEKEGGKVPLFIANQPGPRGIIEALKRGDFNPEIAVEFLINYYAR